MAQVLGTVGFVSAKQEHPAAAGGAPVYVSQWAHNHLVVGDPTAQRTSTSTTTSTTKAKTSSSFSSFSSSSSLLGDSRPAAFANLFGRPCGDVGSNSVPVEVRVSGDIRSAIWDKLMVNASMNSIAALGRADCGEVVAGESSAALLRALVSEASAVGRSLDPPLDLRVTGDSILGLYHSRFGLLPSMLQDVLKGMGPAERGAIVAAVVEVGRRRGVPVPKLEAVGMLLDTLGGSALARVPQEPKCT